MPATGPETPSNLTKSSWAVRAAATRRSHDQRQSLRVETDSNSNHSQVGLSFFTAEELHLSTSDQQILPLLG